MPARGGSFVKGILLLAAAVAIGFPLLNILQSSLIARAAGLFFLTLLILIFLRGMKADRDLRESEEKYRTLIETMGEGAGVVDAEERFTFCNHAAEDIFGVPRGALAGRSLQEFMSPETFARLKAESRKRRAGKSSVYEAEIIRPDGAKRRLLITATPGLEAKGTFAVFRDISERQRAEKAFQTLIKSTAGTVGREFFDTIVKILSEWMGADCAIIGEIVGAAKIKTLAMKLDGEMVEDHSYALAGTPCDGVINQGYCVYPENVCSLFPDDEVLVRLGAEGYVGTPLRDKKGAPIGVLCVISRRRLELPPRTKEVMEIIAARAAAEIERQRAEQDLHRLSIAIEQAAETVVITDPEGTIQYVNPAFEKITGYTREEAIGRNPSFLKSGKHDDAFYREVWETITRGKVWSGHFINQRKDGSLYEEDGTIAPVRDDDGKIVSYVAIKRDVTARVRLEEQLRHSQKMEVVGQLAGGIAHDFNNLLTGMQGYADMLKTALAGDDTKVRYADNILIAARRAATLTKQLLTFARRDTKASVPLDLHALIAEVVGLLKPSLGRKVSVEQQLEAEMPAIMGDPAQLESALLNLGLNARDAMPCGGELTISTKMVALDEEFCRRLGGEMQPGHFIELAFSDTGVGIDAESMPHIFEPFFTTKAVGKGTGLGLASVYGCLQSHGGTIRAESKPGEGTTFYLYLPLLEAGKKPEFPNEGAGASAASKAARSAGHVLVVDDEEVVRELARDMLEHLGYRVTLCRDGREAADYYSSHWAEVNLVLLDMVMPGLDGPATFALLRKIDPKARVLLSSGRTTGRSTQELLDRGASGFVAKPYSLQELTGKVEAALSARMN